MLPAFRRYLVGWMVAPHEYSALASTRITTGCTRASIRPEQLTIHADCGTALTSKPVAILLSQLGVTASHVRPHGIMHARRCSPARTGAGSTDNSTLPATAETVTVRAVDSPMDLGCWPVR